MRFTVHLPHDDARARPRAEIGFGHQVRSYVMQPYTMVKDLRTAVETSDLRGVLDGDLDGFMRAALSRPRRTAGDISAESVSPA